MSIEFYQRKKFDEKNIIENPVKNKDSLEKEGKKSFSSEKNNFTNSQEKKSNLKKSCPRCGKLLDENHKTNLITEEEFARLKEKMEKVSYGELLDTNTACFQIGEEIKEKIKKEFHISEDIRNYKQAHHLISRTDVFFNNKESAIIALSAGYDVNCIENGIVLPSISKEYKPDWNLEDKFRVMSATKKQIHNGHHDFETSFSNKVNSPTKQIHSDHYNFETFFSNEVERLTNEELKKIPKDNYSSLVSDMFEEEIEPFEKKCFLTENDKEKIKLSLNELSQTIKNDIEKFSIDPKSCKFYVSRAALEYAFFLKEKTYKFIKISSFNKNDKIDAEKYKITLNYNFNEIILKKENSYNENYNINFLKFCGDIIFFLYNNKFYFLIENLNFNLTTPSETINFEEIFNENKNIKHKFIEILEKYSKNEQLSRKDYKNKQLSIREIISLRKQNL